jgi:hypothetical protein
MELFAFLAGLVAGAGAAWYYLTKLKTPTVEDGKMTAMGDGGPGESDDPPIKK